ncbi:MAG: hypothetical protein GX033_07695 [Firmicutes bacterium]|nr:hypothetical protein [Bacillota bacterium]
MNFTLYDVIADLHANKRDEETASFLQELGTLLGQPLESKQLEELTSEDLPLIFIHSGGTEGLFKQVYEKLPEPYLILTTGRQNSLAASLEILAFLQQQGKRAQVFHGTPATIAQQLKQIARMEKARRKLAGMRIGVIGQPSDWLIASHVDPQVAQERLGVSLIDIQLAELEAAIDAITLVPQELMASFEHPDPAVVEGALRIYLALKSLVEKYQLGALTVRCFDLLQPYQNTGCIGVALLNDAGITAGCEGDVPSLLSMVIMQALTEEPVFMANPSELDADNNQLIVAHCTVPLTITDSYTLHTHFESDLGIGVRGKIRSGRCTVFKLSSDCSQFFVSGGEIVDNLERSNLCRTQLRITLDEDVNYFLTRPLGNHHLISRDDHVELLKQFLESLGVRNVLK